MDKEKTKVVFRVYPDGEVIALFPQIPVDISGYRCQSYVHVGQHGAANTYIVVSQTKLAKLKQYRRLAKELKSLGYNLDIKKKCTCKDSLIRRKQI